MRHSSLQAHPKLVITILPQAYHEKRVRALLKVTYKEIDTSVCVCVGGQDLKFDHQEGMYSVQCLQSSVSMKYIRQV